MITLRCTRRLLEKLGGPSPGNDQEPTSALGDWYATLLFSRPRHLVLAVSDRARLAVLLPAAPLVTLTQRLPLALNRVLQSLYSPLIPNAVIAREIDQMQSVRIGKTMSRSTLSTMNLYLQEMPWEDGERDLPGFLALDEPTFEGALLGRSLHLADRVSGRGDVPHEVARVFLLAAQNEPTGTP